MELIENLLQLLTTFIGALLSGIEWQKSSKTEEMREEGLMKQ